MDARLAVVYLVRYIEDTASVRRFIDSYKRFRAGVGHELVIIWKGFPNQNPDGSDQLRICNEVQHRSIAVTDCGFDIGAYRRAAEFFPYQAMLFANTFSEVQADDWLKLLWDSFMRDDVGLVGATASYESLQSSMKQLARAVFLASTDSPYDALLAAQWEHELRDRHPQWLRQSVGFRLRSSARAALRRVRGRPSPVNAFEQAWETHGVFYEAQPRFPNPHVRTNAFLIGREDFLSIAPVEIATKEAAFEFESGAKNLTRLIWSRGLDVAIVGANRRSYAASDWASSETFRRGTQKNKLVADNQTRAFDRMNPAARELSEKLTWG
jgi:hypothetical protein